MNRQRTIILFAIAMSAIAIAIFTWVKTAEENVVQLASHAESSRPPSETGQGSALAVQKDNPLTRLPVGNESSRAEGEATFRPANSLKVIVESPTGKPRAHIPVSIWHFKEGSHAPWLDKTTNSQGVVDFSLPPYEVGKDFTMVVGFAFPCGNASSFKILRSEIPTTPLSFTLADTGTVKVQLLNELGKPWLQPTEVHCVPASDSTAPLTRPRTHSGPGRVLLTSGEHGQISFPCVPSEVSLQVFVSNMDFGDWEQKVFEAPARKQTVELALRLHHANPRASFRILKPDGTPLALHPWTGWLNQFSIEEGNNWTWIYPIKGTTDSAGNASIAITDRLDGKTWTSRDLVIEAVLDVNQPALRGRQETHSIDLTKSPLLGDIRLAPASVFASGYVLSTSGNPIHQVMMVAQEEYIVSTQVRSESKYTHTPTQIILNDDGAFQLMGSLPAKLLKLQVSAPGFHTQEIFADVGDTNLEIRLEPSLVVSGQLAGLSKETLEKTRVHYVPPGSEVAGFIKSGKVVTQTPDSEGRFLLSGIDSDEAGKVQVFIQHSDAPFVEVHDVIPWPEGGKNDPRFHPLSTDEPFAYRIYLKTPEGAPAVGAKHHIDFSFGMANRPDSTFPQNVSEEYFETYAATDELELNFHHKAYRPIFARVKPGVTTLNFQPPLFVQIELSPAPEVPDDIEIFFLVEDKADGNITRHAGRLAELTPAALKAVPVSSAGIYVVSLFLNLNDSWPERIEIAWPSGEKFLEVEVLDQPDQVFQITYPYQGIQDAIQLSRKND